MRKATPKCSKCKKELAEGEGIEIKGKLICHDCAKENSQFIKLRDYLYELSGRDTSILLFLLKQVKQLKEDEECPMTDSGIYWTLKYVFELSDNPPEFNPKYGIKYVVINNYYWAKKHYDQIKKLHNQTTDAIDEAINMPIKTIHLNQGILKYTSEAFLEKLKIKKYGPPIDLNDIEDEEEDVDEEN